MPARPVRLGSIVAVLIYKSRPRPGNFFFRPISSNINATNVGMPHYEIE